MCGCRGRKIYNEHVPLVRVCPAFFRVAKFLFLCRVLGHLVCRQKSETFYTNFDRVVRLVWTCTVVCICSYFVWLSWSQNSQRVRTVSPGVSCIFSRCQILVLCRVLAHLVCRQKARRSTPIPLGLKVSLNVYCRLHSFTFCVIVVVAKFATNTGTYR